MRSIVRLLLSVFTLLWFGLSGLNAQSVVNAYAKVTDISGTTLTLSDINEANDTFVAGEQIVIMQMQDDVIGTNTSNDSNFGTLDNIQSAGLYEVVTIAAVTSSTITLSSSLKNTYHTGANSSVQVISFPDLGGGGDYTTTSDLTALAWNGSIGGVLALQVGGVLTLNHDIVVDGMGFRGGAVSANSGTHDCLASLWITSNTGYAGKKGEGIYKITDTSYEPGRAKAINGGGAGARHNGGGGGGGNVTSGGEGGDGWSCSANPVGGQGGVALGSYITAGRIFMGGGGGGGQQNNSVGSSGANGGGIILIKANELVTASPCGGRIISANGNNASNTGNDGAGGAGAGGTIVLSIPNFNVDAGCILTVAANGGSGGSVNSPDVHGAGGGGGQGRVIFSASQPANTSVSTGNGTSGCNDDSSPCTSTPDEPPSGTDDEGISDEEISDPLPVSLLYFKGFAGESGEVVLKWGTGSELNNDFFTIERSYNASNWEVIGIERGHGIASEEHNYSYTDDIKRVGTLFYRLSQTDFDGTRKDLQTITVKSDLENNHVLLYPNPGKGQFTLLFTQKREESGLSIEMFDTTGGQVEVDYTLSDDKVTFQLDNKPRGMYMLKVSSGGKGEIFKLMLE